MIEKVWNIIFLGINIVGDNIDDNATVNNGIIKFIDDVKGTLYSENLKITLLHFENPTPKGIAKIFQNNQGLDSNHSFYFKENRDFDCQEEKYYSDFYESLINENQVNNKYLIIFLAHSFGAGFFYYQKKYFTTINFSNALQTAFKNVKVDCLMALNCEIQSIESNIIFKNTVSLLIGSQRPLYVKSISYKELLNDLTRYSYWNDEILYSKFLYNCFSYYSSFFNRGEEYLFSLTLSKPKNAAVLLGALNALAELFDLENKKNKLLNERDIDLLGNVRAFCYDPSYSDKINIFDSHEFFNKVKELFYSNSEITDAIDFIVELLNKVVVLFLASADTFKFQVNSKPKKMFLGNGIGLFIPKVDSLNLNVVYTIYSLIYKKNGMDLVNLQDEDWNDVIKNFIKHLGFVDFAMKKSNFDILSLDQSLLNVINAIVNNFLNSD